MGLPVWIADPAVGSESGSLEGSPPEVVHECASGAALDMSLCLYEQSGGQVVSSSPRSYKVACAVAARQEAS